MCNLLNSLSFNVLMVFLMMGGFVNSVIAIPTTLLIGAFGIAGNLLGIAYFGYRAYKEWNSKNFS